MSKKLQIIVDHIRCFCCWTNAAIWKETNQESEEAGIET